MNLSQNFTLEELCITQQRGLINVPPPEVERNLATLATLLERARFLLEDRPIIVSSGYRSEAVNRAVGGAKDSAHMKGYAADFICPRFGSPIAVARRLDSGGLPFDQLIYEGTWVHISCDPRQRREVLTAHFGKPTTYTAGIA